MTELLRLFLCFFKIGALTFGGGYAMLPILQREAAEKHGWLSDEQVVDYYAVAQCLPGIIAANTAILTGYRVRGRLGGLVSALGVATPSLMIIMIIAAFLRNLLEYEIVQNAFWGIRVVVSALIVQAVIKVWKSAMKSVFSYVLYGGALALSWFTNISTAVIVAAAVLLGIGYGVLVIDRREDKKP
jgi:chromate transporter